MWWSTPLFCFLGESFLLGNLRLLFKLKSDKRVECLYNCKPCVEQLSDLFMLKMFQEV